MASRMRENERKRNRVNLRKRAIKIERTAKYIHINSMAEENTRKLEAIVELPDMNYGV